MGNTYAEITPKIKELTQLCLDNSQIDASLYTKYQVNRGLRDLKGKGVLTGLTEISEIQSSVEINGESVPCEGKLFYRGIDIEQIVGGFIQEKRYGFEETVYLLLFGNLPSREQLADFQRVLADYRTLPTSFVRDIIMKAPSPDMMNTLARSVLTRMSFHGPLRVQRPFYPEGPLPGAPLSAAALAEPCHCCLLHPPGGLVSGDDLRITALVEPQAHVLLTTP